MKILFFDDEKIRFDIFKQRVNAVDEIVYCQSIEDCKAKLQEHLDGKTLFDVIHFDHDIQNLTTHEWYSSVSLAEWFVQICDKNKAPSMVVIHSVNALGSWTLYHIFCRLTKTFMSPFRIDINEYGTALDAIKVEKNDKIQEREKEIPKQG